MSRYCSSLPALAKGCDVAALAATRQARWRPGLATPLHSEVFAAGDQASGAALALALARDGLRVARAEGEQDPLAESQDRRQVLWVQDRAAVRLTGRPYRHGLPPDLRDRLIHVEAQSAEDALFALEEGLRCRDLAFVLGEIAGNPKALSFTASRRLSLAAEKHGVPLFLVRIDARADLSSARMRWNVSAEPSPPPQWNAAAPGTPSWKTELFRARTHAPGEWILRDEGHNLAAERHSPAAPDPVDLVRAAGA